MAFLSKFSTFIVSTAVGVIGKISYEIGMKRRMSLIQWFGIVGMSIFAGYITSVWCVSNGWKKQGQYIVPITTLLGEKILIYLTTHYKSILHKLLAVITPKR